MPPRANGKGKGGAKAPPGAKRRAAKSLLGAKREQQMTDAEIRSFWDARLHKLPPAIRTTFGNFTTVNSVDRWTWQVSGTSYLYVPWSPSAIASLNWSPPSGIMTQHLYDVHSINPPNAIRPLRMSLSIENIGQLVNSGGDVRIYSVDQAIVTGIQLGVLPTTAAGLITPTVAAPLIGGSPDTMQYPIASLTEEHSFISVPSSYPAYNTYYDFVPLVNPADLTNLISVDAWQLVEPILSYDNYPASTSVFTGVGPAGCLASLPPMRGFLVEVTIPASVSQTLRITTHRQDGCRYQVNTLGHAFAHCPPKMNAMGEDAVLAMTRHVSSNPAVGFPTAVMSQLGSFAEGLSAVLAGTGSQVMLQGLGRLVRPALNDAARNTVANAMRLMLT